ncbi:helix-turn-helix domain-containing protein [Castellaniella ginsengisoli]
MMTGPRKANALREQGVKAAKQGTARQANYNPNSTATEAQLQRVMALLRIGPQTSHDLLKAGIYHPPRRIRDLRERGNVISTERVTLTDRDGFQHRGCAEYALIREVR